MFANSATAKNGEQFMPIFDQGYQRWSGKLSGHAWRWLAITKQGVRTGLTIKWMRWLLLAAWTPALALATVLCAWGLLERNSDLITPYIGFLKTLFGPQSIDDPRAYRVEVWTLCFHYFLQVELWLSLLLILVIGPNLISQDLRFNALPLYFSRPLRRIDYVLGKLGVIMVFLAMILILPCIVAYILGLAFSLDLSIVKDTIGLLLAAVLYGLVIVVSGGLLMLALSSLTRNSRYVGLFWLAILIVGAMVASVLEGVEQHQQMRGLRHGRGNGLASYGAVAVEASERDWRPLVSYTANLSRIGQQLLGVRPSFEKMSQWVPPNERNLLLLDYVGPQFPWYWSAYVLLFWLGLSAWILNRQIKSLDRLK
jgi:ABC-2 type transport system permease protein